MNWFSALMGVVSGVLSFIRLRLDPDNIRLSKREDYDNQLDKLREKRDEILSRIKQNPTEDDAHMLGIVTERIVYLRRKKSTLGG